MSKEVIPLERIAQGLAWAGQFPPRAQTLFGNALVLAVTQPERARLGFPTLFPLGSSSDEMQTAGPVGSRAIFSSLITLNVSNEALGFDSPSRPSTSVGAKQSFADKCVPKQSLGTRRRGKTGDESRSRVCASLNRFVNRSSLFARIGASLRRRQPAPGPGNQALPHTARSPDYRFAQKSRYG